MLEARCRRADVEVLRRLDIGVVMWRYGVLEARCRRADSTTLERCSDVEVRSSRALQSRCSCADGELC